MAEPVQHDRQQATDATHLQAEASVNLTCNPGNGTAAWNATAIDLRPNTDYDTKFLVVLDRRDETTNERTYKTSSNGNFTTNTYFTYEGFDTILVSFNVYDQDGRYVVGNSDTWQS